MIFFLSLLDEDYIKLCSKIMRMKNMKLEGSLPAQIYYQLANLEGPTGNEENDLRDRIQKCVQKFNK